MTETPFMKLSFMGIRAQEVQLLTCRLKSIPFCSKCQKRENQIIKMMLFDTEQIKSYKDHIKSVPTQH